MRITARSMINYELCTTFRSRFFVIGTHRWTTVTALDFSRMFNYEENSKHTWI